MPPFLPRRNYDTPPAPKNKKKPTLFDAADHATPTKSLEENEKFAALLNESDDGSSLTDIASSDFEDVPATKKQKHSHEESDEEVEWEDALQPVAETINNSSEPTGDLELTLTKGINMGSLTDPYGAKKGPSKIERQIRIATHCMHVQYLMWHNWSRSMWANDKEVQKILLSKLDDQCKQAVDDWRRRSGIIVEEAETAKSNSKARGKRTPKKTSNKKNTRGQRDWGDPAVRQEPGKADLSAGDPIIRLLEMLVTWWKKNFRISAPALRKIGYKPLIDLQSDIASFRNDSHDPEKHGERIDGIHGFCASAKSLEGSRDVGAQLFTALLRGLNIETRLVASLQPTGFGWNKAEEAHPKKEKLQAPKDSDSETHKSDDEDEGIFLPEVKSKKFVSQTPKKIQKSATNKKPPKMFQRKPPPPGSMRKQPARGAKDVPIELTDNSSELSEPPEVSESEESVIDVTSTMKIRKPNARYDRDMSVPNYWVEAVAPLSQQVIPIDPIVNYKVVLRDEEKFTSFEPRGKKAEKAKQVFAYVVAFSPDGTAKEVTTRYLKRHMWPGKTKGVRMPVEKIAVYNRRGKVKRYEQYDWFKVVMSYYRRSDKQRTMMDDVEDSTDLKPVKPEKKPMTEGVETLQGYKQSAEYVLERHLRREEALLPTAKPVKTFTHGKGEKQTDDPVFRRKDVVVCRTAESWHKEGRQVKAGMQPLKRVPVRAVTLTRKLEIEQTERETGEKATQGMYSKEQTEYIIPPPIENGVIPKNAYGNIDCFVETMVPEGAIHIPYKGTVKVCKKLGIDFAEAVVGFEFGNKRAVPVTQGVVVAAENEDTVVQQLEKDEEEKRIKEEGKREKAALSTWKKLLMGLRIVQRVREEYGDEADEDKDEINPFTNRNPLAKSSTKNANVHDVEMTDHNDEDMEGGFVVEDVDD